MGRLDPAAQLLLQQIAKVICVAIAVAWILTYTCNSVIYNLPLAVAIVVFGCYLYAKAEGRQFQRPRWKSLWTGNLDEEGAPHFMDDNEAYRGHHGGQKAHWRQYIKSKVVEHAWETLCGSIVQEFIYDTWYAAMTPDKEFPAEIRHLLNHAFGQLGARARIIDLRAVLNDTSELLMEQVELFRDTREALGPEYTESADPDLKEALIRTRMAADGNLHPALRAPDGDYRMLRAVADGMTKSLLGDEDRRKPMLTSVARELLAACVLRPLLLFCTPYYCNKAMYKLLSQHPDRIRQGIIVPALQQQRARNMRGNWEFEQRVMSNVRAEDDLITRAATLPPRRQHNNHNRSQSFDSFLPSGHFVAPSASVDTNDDITATTTTVSDVAATTQSLQQHLGGGGERDVGPTETHGITGEESRASTPRGVETSGASTTSQSSTHTVTSPAPRAKSMHVLAPGQVSRSGTPESTSGFHNEAVMVHGEQQHELVAAAAKQQPPAVTTPGLPRIQTSVKRVEIAQGLSRPSPFDIHTHTDNLAAVPADTSVVSSQGDAISLNGDHHHTTTSNAIHPQQQQQQETSIEGSSPIESNGNYATGAAPSRINTTKPIPPLNFDQPSSSVAPSSVEGDSDDTASLADSTLAADPFSHLIAAAADAEALMQAPRSPRPHLSGLRARVVAAELNTRGSKDYVMYQIRVADASGLEWTVSRRYRHFEVLHRQMKSKIQGYKLKLPPKRIFVHTPNVDFVHERQEALDSYLQALLAHPSRSSCVHEITEFLQAGSEVYELLPPARHASDRLLLGPEDSLRRGLTRGVSRGVQAVVGTAIGGVGAVKDTIFQGAAEVTTAAVGGVGNVLAEARSSLKHRRTLSVPQDLAEMADAVASGQFGVLESTSEGAAMTFDSSGVHVNGSQTMPRRASQSHFAGGHHQRSDSIAGRTANGIIRTATASARKIRNVVVPGNNPDSKVARALDYGDQDRVLLGDTTTTAATLGGSDQSGLNIGRRASNLRRVGSTDVVHLNNAGSLRNRKSSKKLKPGASPTRRGRSPSKLRPNLPPLRPTVSDVSGSQRPRYDSAQEQWAGQQYTNYHHQPGLPGPPRSKTMPGGSRNMGVLDVHGDASATGQYPHHNQQPPLSPMALFAAELAPGASLSLDPEECAGISAPLYEIVDCLFQLQTRGFFRRQVFGVARQVLSLVIGDAIDVFLVSKLRLLRQEHTIGKVIQLIQNSLWPGGRWYQYSPQYLAMHPPPPPTAASAQPNTPLSPRATASADWTEDLPAHARSLVEMRPEDYLKTNLPKPIDEDELREAVLDLLLKRSPTPLVRLVGNKAYSAGVTDLWELMQSETFVKQLGYGVLEVLTLHLFPEMKSMFTNMEPARGL